MSVGIHSGRFDFLLVGDPDLHRELLIAGPAASITTAMESIAEAGQIAVSDATAALLPPGVVADAVPGGRLLRAAPVLRDASLPDVPPEDPGAAGLLPPPVRAHLRAAQGEPEDRPGEASVEDLECRGVAICNSLVRGISSQSGTYAT